MPGVPAACAYPSSHHLSHPAPDTHAHEADASDAADEQPTRKLPSSGALPRLDQRPTQDQCARPFGSTSDAVAPGPKLPGPSAAEYRPSARVSEQSTAEEVWLVLAVGSAATPTPTPAPTPTPIPYPYPYPYP